MKKMQEDFLIKLRKRDYKSSTEIAIETVSFFHKILEKHKWKNLDDVLEFVSRLGKDMIASVPLEFCVGNIIKRILRIIRDEIKNNSLNKNEEGNEKEPEKAKLQKKKTIMGLTSFGDLLTLSNNKVNKIKDKDYESDNEGESKYSANKDNILTLIDELIREIEGIYEIINDQSTEYIHDNDVILTANESSQLEEFFRHASLKRKFHVIIAESAPNLGGVNQARNLAKYGIKTTVISDASVYSIMSRVNKVIIGTHSIMANGGLISYSGIYNVCLSAQAFSIPVMVVAGTYKLTPYFPFDHQTFNELYSPNTIFKRDFSSDLSNFKFFSPVYDYVPPEFVTIYITNQGSQNPAYIYRFFNEFYSQEDYLL